MSGGFALALVAAALLLGPAARASSVCDTPPDLEDVLVIGAAGTGRDGTFCWEPDLSAAVYHVETWREDPAGSPLPCTGVELADAWCREDATAATTWPTAIPLYESIRVRVRACDAAGACQAAGPPSVRYTALPDFNLDGLVNPDGSGAVTVSDFVVFRGEFGEGLWGVADFALGLRRVFGLEVDTVRGRYVSPTAPD